MIAIFPKIASCVAARDWEQLGVLVRRYFGGDHVHAVVPDLVSYFQAIDIPLTRAPMKGRAAIAARDVNGRFHLSAWLHPDVLSGSEEERLLLAHLLGHFFIHIQPQIMRGEWKDGGFKEMMSPGVRMVRDKAVDKSLPKEELQDREADAFAAAFLMPKAFIVRAKDQLRSIEKMAQFFRVPADLLWWRLDQVWEGAQPPDFLQAEIRLVSRERSQAAVRTAQNERQGAQIDPTSPAEPSTPETGVTPESLSRLKGIEKIRQLARQMEKGPTRK